MGASVVSVTGASVVAVVGASVVSVTGASVVGVSVASVVVSLGASVVSSSFLFPQANIDAAIAIHKTIRHNLSHGLIFIWISSYVNNIHPIK